MKRIAFSCLALLLSSTFAQAQPATPPADQSQPTATHAEQDTPGVTQHTVSIAGSEVPYTATAATLQLTNANDEPLASIFYIAYTRDDVEDTAKRPVMFCFNGGPGSSSIWLHMGCFGPRRVAFDEVGHTIGPPYELTDNHLSLLDTTDLVFIDPVSTGFSTTEGDTRPGQYHSVTGDIRSVGEFIRLWITENNRWRSPKFLAGESYGTTRAAGLSQHLQNEGIAVSGVVLVSAVLNFQTLRFDEGNDLPYTLYMPTYTALAHYHGKLADDLAQRDLPELLDEVEAWARDTYTPALMRGRELPDDQRAAIVRDMVRYTGLSEDLIDRSNLRIPQWRFGDALLDDQRSVIGRFDGRIVGPDLDRASDRSGTGDPSYYRVAPGFTASFNDYVRNELNYETSDNYEVLAGLGWDFDIARNSYPNISGDLRRAMTENPALHVFVAAGYYDLATPYHAAEYTLNQAITHPHAVDRVTVGYYESGHMIFTHGESLEKFRNDLLPFFEQALGGAD
ncbi:MAG: S10 family peptidase [Phycisphaerales bacterium JB063]